MITSASKEEAIIYHWVDNFYCFLEHKPICLNNLRLPEWRGTDSQLGVETIIISRLHILFNHLIFKAYFFTVCITVKKKKMKGSQKTMSYRCTVVLMYKAGWLPLPFAAWMFYFFSFNQKLSWRLTQFITQSHGVRMVSVRAASKD